MNLLKKLFSLFIDENYKNKYKVISILGALIRYCMLFILRKTLVNEIGVTLTIVAFICSFIINYLIEKPLHYFTFYEVGIFYESGNPILGSILYTSFYIINCIGIIIIIWFYNFLIYYICIALYIILVLSIRGIIYIFRDR